MSFSLFPTFYFSIHILHVESFLPWRRYDISFFSIKWSMWNTKKDALFASLFEAIFVSYIFSFLYNWYWNQVIQSKTIIINDKFIKSSCKGNQLNAHWKRIWNKTRMTSFYRGHPFRRFYVLKMQRKMIIFTSQV